MEFSQTYIGRLRAKIGTELVNLPGARIVIENASGEVLLQKRGDFNKWGLPAGSAESDESMVDCIKRELMEETGLTANSLNCFGHASDPADETVTYPNGDRIHCFCLLFYSREWSGNLSIDGKESLDLKFFSIDDLPDMIPNHRKAVKAYRKFLETKDFQLC